MHAEKIYQQKTNLTAIVKCMFTRALQRLCTGLDNFTLFVSMVFCLNI